MACVVNARTSQVGSAVADKAIDQAASENAFRERSTADYGAYLGIREAPIAKKHPASTRKGVTKVDLKAKARRSSSVAEATLASEADTGSRGDDSKGTGGSMSSCLVDECGVRNAGTDEASAADHAFEDRTAAMANGCEVSPEMLDGCDISTWPDFSLDPLGAGEIDDLDVPGNLMLPDPEDALLEKPSGGAGGVKREPDVTEDTRPSETFHSESQLNDQSDLTSKDNSKSPVQKKKPKVDWTPELHRRFVNAVEQLGVDKAIPSRILELMGVKFLTRHNIASHLQKYRSHRRHLAARDAEAANWHGTRTPADSGASAGSAWQSPPAGTPGKSAPAWAAPGVPPTCAPASAGVDTPANGVPPTSNGGVSQGVPQGVPTTGHPATMMPPRQVPGMMHCPPMPFHPQAYANMQMMHPHQAPPAMSGMLPPPPPAMGMPVWGHPTPGGCPPGGPARAHMWGHPHQQQQQQSSQQMQHQQQHQAMQQMQPRVAAYPPPSWLAVEGSSPWHHYPAFPAGPSQMDAWPHPCMPARGMPCFPPRQHPLSYPMPPNCPPNGAPNGMVCGSPVCPPNSMPHNSMPHNSMPHSVIPASGCHPSGLAMPPPFPGMPMMPGLPHAPGFDPSPGHAWGMGLVLPGAAEGAVGGAGAGAGSGPGSGSVGLGLGVGLGGAVVGGGELVADEAMPNPMFPLSEDLSVDLATISASIGDDLHEANDILDAAISEALTNPSMPLPLGLKPPSLDGVLDELNRQGIRMPAANAAADVAPDASAGDVAAAAGLGDAPGAAAAAGVDGGDDDGVDEDMLSLADDHAALFCSPEAMAAAASFLKEEAI